MKELLRSRSGVALNVGCGSPGHPNNTQPQQTCIDEWLQRPSPFGDTVTVTTTPTSASPRGRTA